MIYAILILAFILRLILADQSFWLDEAASLVISNRPFTSIFSYLNSDFHPPLHYLITKLTLVLGLRSELSLRMPNIIFGVLTIYFLYQLVEALNTKISIRLFSKKIPISIVAALLLTLNPLHIYYSQELRMYALSALLTTLSWLYLIQFTNSKTTRNLILLTLINVTNIFTFYGTAFNLIAQLVYIFFYHKNLIKKLVFSNLVVFVCFTPWIPTLLIQIQGSQFLKSLPGWNAISGELSIKSILLIPAKFSFGRINFSTSKYFLLVGAIVTLYYTSLAFISGRKKTSHLFLIWLTAPLLIAAMLSVYAPMLGYWRYIYLLPAFSALIAIGISLLPQRVAALNLFMIVFLMLLSNYLFWTTPAYHREDWRAATQFINEEQQLNNAHPIFAFADAFAPVLWYQPNLSYTAPLRDIASDPSLLDLRLAQGTNGKSDIYYFRYLSDLTDPSHNITTWLSNAGYVVVQTKDFQGVGFVDHFQAIPQ